MSLRYGRVEAALAIVCGIAPKDIGAFRARLRHLRNIESAHWPKPGSGRQISYSERQVLEMLIALQLETHGHTPRNAALLAQSIVQQSPYGQHQGQDCYIVVHDPRTPKYTQAIGEANLMRVLKVDSALFLVINVSAHVRNLNRALDLALAND